jgi:PQQ-dependent dehydrogenase (methanol/ethanol family)
MEQVMTRWLRLAASASAIVAVAMLAASAKGQEGDQFTDDDWPTFGRTFDQIRHSPLTGITKDNVSQLGRAFSFDFAETDPTIPLEQQTYPLVVDGVIYATTALNHVFAVDGATGEEIWHYQPDNADHLRNFGPSQSSGVAYCDGKVFLLTLDLRLIALDAARGEPADEARIANAVDGAEPSLGYVNTAAPICFDGIVLVGVSGPDSGIRGFVMAYNADDLSPAWANPVWTVPPEGQDWRAPGRFHGGGSVAMPVAIDPDSETVYIPVAGPSPAYHADLRPAATAKTNSVIAVDLRTGQERWWQQQLAGDGWGYDTIASPLVITADIGGDVNAKVVSVATREGVVFVYDAATGEPIYERIELLDRIEHPSLEPGAPVTIYPSPLGGVDYATASYDPTTNFQILAAAETAAVLTQARSAAELEANRIRGDLDLGLTREALLGQTPEGWKDTGSVVAIDMGTGVVAWKLPTPEPERGGVTTTATGIGFVGGGDGVLRAFDTSNGEILWEHQTGAQIAAAPSIYAIDGKQYVAIAVGGTPTSYFGGTASRLEVFTLGGDQSQATPPRLAEGPSAQGTAEPGAWLSAGDEPNTLKLHIVASPGEDGKITLDGLRDGALRLEIPQGWKVNVTYVGHDREADHSLVLGQQAGDAEAAFEGATTSTPTLGTVAAVPEYFTFTASTQGTFALGCGVDGHAADGEWGTVEVVSPDAPPRLFLGESAFTVTVAGPS